MTRQQLKILLRVIAVCAVAVLLEGQYMQCSAQFSTKPDAVEFRKAGLAMEFARTAEEARKIMPEPSDRIQMARVQRIDFLFIGTYWLLYGLMSWLLMRRTVPGAAWLGLLTLLCATLVAWFDIREDLAILAVIRAAENTNDNMVALIRHYSVIKWTLLFLMTILLSIIFIPRRDFKTWTGKFSTAAGLCFVAFGLIGLAGLANHHYIPIALLVVGIGSLLIIGMFVFAADAFLDAGAFRSEGR